MADTATMHIDFQASLESVNNMAKQVSGAMFRTMMEAVGEGTKAGLDASFLSSSVKKDISDVWASNLTKGAEEANKKIKALNTEMQTALNSAQSAADKKQIEEKFALRRQKVEQEFANMSARMNQFADEEFKLRSEKYKKLNKILAEGNENAAKHWGEQAGKEIKGVTNIFQALKSGKIGDVFTELSGMQGRRAGRKHAKAGKLMKQGKVGQAAVMGKSAAMLGKSALMLGAAAAPLAAAALLIGGFVILLMKAFSHMQEFNKEILKLASSMDVAASYGGDLQKGLQDIRGAAAHMDMVTMGFQKEDVLKVLGAYNTANLTFKELRGNAKAGAETQAKFQNVMLKTAAIARSTGMEMEKVAEMAAVRLEEQGGTIEGVWEQFAAVSVAAKDSGFNTKRFFTTVLEATSGMALYNARVAEAGNLLINLGKVLGAKMAGDTLKELSKGFKDESFADSYKRVLKTGGAASREVFKTEASVASQQFLTNLGEQSTQLKDALKTAVNVDLDLSGNAEENAERLAGVMGKLTNNEREKLVGELIANKNFNRDNVRQISSLISLGRAASGNQEDMAMAMNELGPGGVLYMQLKAANKVLGANTKIHDLSLTQAMALQSMEGYSREQIKKLQEISVQSHGSWTKLQEMYNSGNIDMSNEDMVKAFGAYITENGDIIAAKLDENGVYIEETSERQVKNAEQLVALQMAQQEKELKPAMKLTEFYSWQTAVATVTLGDLMKGTIAAILETIAGYLVPIMAWVTGGLSEDEKEAKQEALTQLHGKRKAERETRMEQKDIMNKQREILKTSKKDSEEYKKAEKEYNKAERKVRQSTFREKGIEAQEETIKGYQQKKTSFTIFGMDAGSLIGQEENEIGRVDLSSAENYIKASEGRGVGTGSTWMESGTEFALTTGIPGGGGYAMRGLSTAAKYGAPAVVGAGGVYADARTDPMTKNLQKTIDNMTGEQKKIYEFAVSQGVTGSGAVQAAYGKDETVMNAWLAAEEKRKKREEEAKKEAEKTSKSTSETVDELKDIKKEQKYAAAMSGQPVNYGGGTDAAALTALGQQAKGLTGSKKAEFLEALKNFDAGDREIVKGGMKDGYALFSPMKGSPTVVPLDRDDQVEMMASKKGGGLSKFGGGRGGTNIYNFYGGSTEEIIAHFESIRAELDRESWA